MPGPGVVDVAPATATSIDREIPLELQLSPLRADAAPASIPTHQLRHWERRAWSADCSIEVEEDSMATLLADPTDNDYCLKTTATFTPPVPESSQKHSVMQMPGPGVVDVAPATAISIEREISPELQLSPLRADPTPVSIPMHQLRQLERRTWSADCSIEVEEDSLATLLAEPTDNDNCLKPAAMFTQPVPESSEKQSVMQVHLEQECTAAQDVSLAEEGMATQEMSPPRKQDSQVWPFVASDEPES